MREMHCAVHCHVKPMQRSLFSAYVESGLQASTLLPSAFGDRDARKRAVERAASRPASAALVAELAAQQSAFPESAARQRALETLARPGTAAVLTGQQVGLFLGPLYTIYKAASAIVLAEALAVETGTPVVPIFWMATEDHDLPEVDHCTVARGSEAPLRLRVSADGRSDARAPVAEARLGADCSAAVDAVRDALAGKPAGAEVAALLAEHYAPGRSFGAAFGGLLAALFADEGLLVFHPRTPGAAALAAPAYRHALAHAGVIAERLVARDAALAEAGFDSQVHVRADAAVVFAHDERGGRQLVRLEEALAQSRVVDADPTRFSSSALVRPIVQDTLFPTAAYVGGPAECSYFGQSSAIYDLFDLPVPLVAPRARFRLVDGRTRARLDSLGLQPADVEQPLEPLLTLVGSRRPAPIAAGRAARRHPRRAARRARHAARPHRRRRPPPGARLQPHARDDRARRRAADRALRPHARAPRRRLRRRAPSRARRPVSRR